MTNKTKLGVCGGSLCVSKHLISLWITSRVLWSHVKWQSTCCWVNLALWCLFIIILSSLMLDKPRWRYCIYRNVAWWTFNVVNVVIIILCSFYIILIVTRHPMCYSVLAFVVQLNCKTPRRLPFFARMLFISFTVMNIYILLPVALRQHGWRWWPGLDYSRCTVA